MNITFVSLAGKFLRSRGGLIALAAIISVVLRLFAYPVTSIDLAICVAVVVAWPISEWFFHRFVLHAVSTTQAIAQATRNQRVNLNQRDSGQETIAFSVANGGRYR